MPYTFKSEGVGEVMNMLQELGDSATFVASQALYDGAGVMADVVTEEAKKIITAPFHYVAVPGAVTRFPSPEEKEILLNEGAMGISKFRKGLGSVDTSVGYNGAGYAPVTWNHMRSSARTNYKLVSVNGRQVNASSKLKAMGAGKGGQNLKPVGVIANAINSGTSFMKKQPFIRRGFKKGSRLAEKAIVERAESLIEYITQTKQVGGRSA